MSQSSAGIVRVAPESVPKGMPEQMGANNATKPSIFIQIGDHTSVADGCRECGNIRGRGNRGGVNRFPMENISTQGSTPRGEAKPQRSADARHGEKLHRNGNRSSRGRYQSGERRQGNAANGAGETLYVGEEGS